MSDTGSKRRPSSSSMWLAPFSLLGPDICLRTAYTYNHIFYALKTLI
jgi:hypothetical protein